MITIDARTMLQRQARSVAAPISWLPDGLRETLTSVYLCLRAIDEIEDHPELSLADRSELLTRLARCLRARRAADATHRYLQGQAPRLPEVTLRLSEWTEYAPAEVRPRIKEETAAMALRMADWVRRAWNIGSEDDLDDYTYAVCGAAGLMLNELWMWFDGTRGDRRLVVDFFRGLQAVHILQVTRRDPVRGTALMPDGWQTAQLVSYIDERLKAADAYVAELKEGPVRDYNQALLAMARPTVHAVLAGRDRVDRASALRLMRAAHTSRRV